MPLDVCGAESQGQIGYLLQVTIGDVFFERGMERPVVTVLTLTRVRAERPAFQKPTKYVGPYFTEAQARRLEEQRGWAMKADPARRAGAAWSRARRPTRSSRRPAIAQLVADGRRS